MSMENIRVSNGQPGMTNIKKYLKLLLATKIHKLKVYFKNCAYIVLEFLVNFE